MSDVTLDQVNVELTSDSSKASKGIDSLVSSLESLKSSSSGAIGGLSNLDNTIKSLMKNFSGLSGSTSSFKNLSNSIRNLKNSASNMQNVKFTGKISDLDLQRQKIEQNKQALEQMQTTASKGTNLNAGTNISELSSKLDTLINKQNILNKNSNLLLHGYRGARQEATGLAGAIGRISGAFKALDKGGRNFVKNIRPAVSIVKSAASHARGLAKSLSDTSGIKRHLKHLSKYVLALFSIRGTYAAIKAFSQSWLDSTTQAAQQLSANIDYLKYALGSAVAPIIEYIANLIYSVLKVIQTVIYILTGINIFAKAFAKNMKSAAGSAAKVNKELSLAPFDELNTIGNLSGGGGGGGAGGVAPTFDLTEVDLKYNKWVEKLVDFFKPLVESWQKYGPDLINQIKLTAASTSRAISATWKSFENIITNGTVYRILQRILKIIQNISDAWTKAWTNNKNGDKIIQNLANTFENLVKAVEKVTSSEAFQKWLSNAIDKIRQISEKLASIDWQPMIDYLAKLGGKIGNAALWTLERIVDLFKWLVEHPKVVDIILKVVGALLTLKTISGVGETISNIIQLFGKTTFPLKASVVLTLAIIDIKIAFSIIKWWNEYFEDVKKELYGNKKELNLFEFINVSFTAIGTGLENAINNFFGKDVTAGIKEWFRQNQLARTILGMFLGQWQDKGVQTTLSNGLFEILKAILYAVAQALRNVPFIGNQIANGIESALSKKEQSLTDSISTTSKNALQGASPFVQSEGEQLGRNTLTAYKTGFESQESLLTTATQKTLNSSLTINESSLKQTSDKLGQSLNSSVRGGFTGQQKEINSDFKSTMNNALTETERDLGRTSNDMGGSLGEEAKSGFENKFNLSGIKIKMPHLSWSTQPASGWTAKILSALNLPTSLPKLNVSWYAEGGFPTTGDLFIANEAGPELIGRMGNQTAVANNDQIKEGIREAAYAAMTQALSENSQGHKTEVYIGNEKVYEGYGRYQNYQSNKYGVSTIRI